MKNQNYTLKGASLTLLVIIAIFSVISLNGAKTAYAVASSAPVVSIGVGNGNTPANTAPKQGGTYSGLIPVYATITDPNNDLQNYHFRVYRGPSDPGFICDDLFATENQGYASTTLGKTACNYIFNQSVYMSDPAGFTNTLIATLNAKDLASFGGEGDYILALGALDNAGNRVDPNYQNDPKIIIAINLSYVAPTTTATSTDQTAGTTTDSTVPPDTSSGGGSTVSGGGHSSGGRSGGGFYSGSQAQGGGNGNGWVTFPTTNSLSVNTPASQTSINGNPVSGGAVATATSSDATSTDLVAISTSTNSNQNLGAAVGLLGFVQNNWWWLLSIIILAALGVYYYTTRPKA